MDVEVGSDRLSSLPDDLIHKILSFLDITEAIGNSVLSPRWRYIWTSMPYLSFTSQDFSTLPKFSKFVMDVLSRRNNLTQVYTLTLKFRGKVSQVFVKRIMNYAVSHNVQQLNVVFLPVKNLEFPLSLVSSKSLKHLRLAVNNNHRSYRNWCYSIIPTSTWELPALTTLELHSATLCDDEAEKCVAFFTKCANLKNLTLKNFTTMGSDGFSISHPLLSNLTLENGHDSVKVVKVVAPHLESLTIKLCEAEHVISAPHLASLLYSGSRPLRLTTDGFHSLEKAGICIWVSYPEDADAHEIVNLLQQLHNVHFLTLNLEIVELLSSSRELVLHQPSPFVNLKRLNIYPYRKYLLEHEPKNVANKVVAELQVLLKEEKDNIKTNGAHVVPREKAPVESHEPKKMKIGGNMAQIKDHWENLGVQKGKACLIISKMQRIEELLAKLPASHRAKMQPCFSSLCAESNIAVSKLADCIKIQCDKHLSRSRVYFHKLATELESSP